MYSIKFFVPVLFLIQIIHADTAVQTDWSARFMKLITPPDFTMFCLGAYLQGSTSAGLPRETSQKHSASR